MRMLTIYDDLTDGVIIYNSREDGKLDMTLIYSDGQIDTNKLSVLDCTSLDKIKQTVTDNPFAGFGFTLIEDYTE